MAVGTHSHFEQEARMFKVYSFIRRNPQLTQTEFVDYFKNVHSQLCKDLLPAMRHYNGNFAVGEQANPDFKHAGFDAVIDQGFDSIEDMHAALNGPAFAIPERVASSHRFMDMRETILMVAEEIKVMG
jgi:hypothetical protein